MIYAYCRCDCHSSGVLGPNIDWCADWHLLLLVGGWFRIRFLVFPEITRLLVSRTLGAASAAESTDREFGITGIQQQVHQFGAERASQEPKRQECQLVRGEQAGAEGKENVHMIQKATQGRLRLVTGPPGFWRIFRRLLVRRRGVGRT